MARAIEDKAFAVYDANGPVGSGVKDVIHFEPLAFFLLTHDFESAGWARFDACDHGEPTEAFEHDIRVLPRR